MLSIAVDENNTVKFTWTGNGACNFLVNFSKKYCFEA